MSGLINLFKSLFGGILGFITGLFGGKKAIEGSSQGSKKSKGYFLELDEAALKSESSKSESATSETETKLEEMTSKPVSQQPMTVSVETATGEDAAGNGQTAKKSTRKEKLAALAANGEQPKAASEKTSEAAVPKAAPVTTVATAPTDSTFATKYLVPTNNGGRRRPGANMSSYLDMARKMNTAG